jgi:arylsulfatase
MPTICALTGATYPKERDGTAIQPEEGVSLLPVLRGEPMPKREIFIEHEGNRSVRDGDWKLVAQHDKPWELYHITTDPTEMRDVASKEPQRVSAMAASWDAWAERCEVREKRADGKNGKAGADAKTPDNPEIANRALSIRCDVETEAKDGVILAQGGNQHGYALHLKDGRLVFTVRIDGKVTAITGTAVSGKFSVAAELQTDGVTKLVVNGKQVAAGNAGGLIPKQPQDALSIGEDARTAVGDYAAPNPLKGKVTNLKITTNVQP